MKKILLLFAINTLPLFAQVEDTLYYFTNNEVVIPLVYSNINSIKATLYRDTTKLENHIRLNYDFGVDLKRATVRDNAFIGEIYDSLDNPGTYHYSCYLTLKNSFSELLKDTIRSCVIVVNPTLASSDIKRSTYYLGESLQFSLATIEYNKVDNYSYSVYANNKMVDSSYGKGTPFVNLDSLLNNSNYADNTITINGFYNKKPFKYNSSTGIKSSAWKFTIKKPILDSDSFWHQNDPTIIPIICANNPKSAIFYFTFLGSTAKQRAIMLGPEIKNLKWEGSVIQSARVTSRPNAVYGTIRIIYNMGAVPVFSSIDEVPETTIRLEFDTQYGHETYSWKAKIFQVQ